MTVAPSRVSKVFRPTDAQRAYVRALAAIGATQAFIASRMPGGGVSIDTLQRHFRQDLHDGNEEACISVKRSLFRAALDSGKPWALPAQLAWLRTYDPGWRRK